MTAPDATPSPHEFALDTLESLMCGTGDTTWDERAIRLAKDYLILESANAQLRIELAGARWIIDSARRMAANYTRGMNNTDPHKGTGNYLADAIADYDAIAAAKESAGRDAWVNVTPEWQEGIAGRCNIVTFDGADIVGVAYVGNANERAIIIKAHNAAIRPTPAAPTGSGA